MQQKFAKLAAKSMNVPNGTNFVCQEVLLLEQSEDRDREMIGCFIDKEIFSIHWYHQNVVNKELGKTYQQEQR